MLTFYIKHPTKGLFTGFDYSNSDKYDPYEMVPKFRWSIPYGHEDAFATSSRVTAETELVKVRKYQPKCYITEKNHA